MLCSVVAGLALAAALAFFVHYFVWPIQIVGGVERQFAWSEGVNTVAVRGADGGELYGLSGRCCAGDRGKVGDGRSRPGPAVVACYGEGVPFRYPVREGVSFTMGDTGGSYGWGEASRDYSRQRPSTVVYGVSECNGRDSG